MNLNFVKNRRPNQIIALIAFKWVVKNTFFKVFNPKLHLKPSTKVELIELQTLRKEMTAAEISHLIAFVLVCVLAIVLAIVNNLLFGLILMLVNVLMNLYPSLLQQQNKRRIDKFMGLLEGQSS